MKALKHMIPFMCRTDCVCVYLCMYAHFYAHGHTREPVQSLQQNPLHAVICTYTHTYDFLLPASHIHSLDVQWKIDVGLSSCQRTLAKAERVQEQMHQPEMTINNAVSSRLRESERVWKKRWTVMWKSIYTKMWGQALDDVILSISMWRRRISN